MKTKSNLLKSVVITSLACICTSALAIGVYAATTHHLDMSGTIAFSASGVKGSISGYTTGLSSNKYYNSTNLQGGSAIPFQNTTGSNLASWNIGTINFIVDSTTLTATDITINFEISNSGESEIGVTISNLGALASNSSVISASYTVQSVDATQTITSSHPNVYFIIGLNQTETFTITLHAPDTTLSATLSNVSLGVSLAEAGGATALTINPNHDDLTSTTMNVPTNAEVVLPPLTRTDYNLTGYKVNNTGDTLKVITANSAKTLYAQWELAYTIHAYTSNNPTYDTAHSIKYQYYVEMGEYPQTMVLTTDSEYTTLNAISDKTLYTSISNPYTIGNNKYVYISSPSSCLTNNLNVITGSSTAPASYWFKIEPVRWIVLGTPETTANQPVLFISSTQNTNWKYENNKFYTKSGGDWNATSESNLLLISEKVLINHRYDASTSAQAFQSSGIYQYMNDTNDSNSLVSQIFTSAQQAKIASTSLTTTYMGNDSGNTQDGNKLFLLANNTTNQNYSVTTYFINNADRISTGTAYAYARGLFSTNSGKTYFWPRSGNSSDIAYAYFVSPSGHIGNDVVYDVVSGVRVAFVLEI